jgi:DNA-binding CsgD family transcriptional regulator
VLRNRRDECDVLGRLLDSVRAGESRVLVVRGEAGVGKSTLLQHVFERTPGIRVERAAGVESELELAFAGLHQLCGSMLDRAERLPGPQRTALRAALGLSSGSAPDPFLVGLAVLGLLGEVARGCPLACVIDDAQWLDRASAQALTFAARRLDATPVAMVFAVRTPSRLLELDGLPELVVSGLPDHDARVLLRTAIPGPIDERVRDRLIAEARGNPLALLELSRSLSSTELAGGYGLPAARSLIGRVEGSYLQPLGSLPRQTRRLLLIAAAEHGGDSVVVWRAADRLGIGVDAARPAGAAGLIEIGERVRFRHPLVRSAIYWAASVDERRKAHHALAEVTDAVADPDGRAWHAAHATQAPDEAVAAELERAAHRARTRGGSAAGAAFLERAMELTAEPGRRAERALAAAAAMHDAAASDAALKLLSIVEAGPVNPHRSARADLLRAQITFAARGDDAPTLLLKAARQLEPLDVGLARQTYLDAISAALFAGPLAGEASVREIAKVARTASRPAGQPRPSDLLLDGMVARFDEGYAAAAPLLKRGLSAFRTEPQSPENRVHLLWLASTTAADLWDDEAWDVLAADHVRLARDTGTLSSLPLALSQYSAVQMFAGHSAAATSALAELQTVITATGSRIVPDAALLQAALQGRETEAAALAETLHREVLSRGQGVLLAVVARAKALLWNSMGQWGEAVAAVSAVGADAPELGAPTWGALVELVEAAARNGQPDRAAAAFRKLIEPTDASGTEWALGLQARCRALVADHHSAREADYREAVDRLGGTRMRVELARSHLLHGEWLRREHRRQDARYHLRTAHEMFADMGMSGFAWRAQRELRATGEHPRQRKAERGSELTAQEAQIVRLVREDLSNSEIGARLFLSRRTVEWHLSNVFAKLGITSRKQLRQ